MNNYNKQSKDDRWLELSESIKDKAFHTCESCGRSKKNNPRILIDVHHLFYDNSRKYWEYKRSELAVLCRGCHPRLHRDFNDLKKVMGADIELISIINGFARAYHNYGSHSCSHPHQALGFAEYKHDLRGVVLEVVRILGANFPPSSYGEFDEIASRIMTSEEW